MSLLDNFPIIDIRSDTVTTPTDAMRMAMMNADVGDDVFSEDPTVNALEQKIAAVFGKESALFVPSGCMGNQICIALHAGTGDEIIVESESHIVHYETTSPSLIARVQLRTVSSNYGEIPLDALASAVRPTAYYFPRTALVCLENSHNRHGGTVLQLEYIQAVREFCNEYGLPLHCDGARIWNASIASGVAMTDYGKHFDTLSVCLSKGLGAPIGSVILGTVEMMNKARRWRKMLGGGMRQVGILAAAGLYALENHLALLSKDHHNAKEFYTQLKHSNYFEVSPNEPETNIVLFKLRSTHLSPEDILLRCSELGLRLSLGREGGWMRAVFHHQVSAEQTLKATDIIVRVCSQ